MIRQRYPIKRRKPLCKVSKAPHRLAKRFVPAAVLKEVKERSGGQCERQIVFESVSGWAQTRCIRRAMNQPHHLLARSQGGKHEPDNLKDLCFECHNWAHANPTQAEKEGLLRRRSFNPPSND